MLRDLLGAPEGSETRGGDAVVNTPEGPDGAHAFSHVVPLEGDTKGAYAEMTAWGHGFDDTLFIGTCDACAFMRDAHPQAVCLPVAEGRVEECVRTASNLAAKYLRWQFEVSRIVAAGGTFQDVVDASEHLTGNPMVLSDAAFRIVAYTREAIPDVPFVREAIERGAFDNQTMELFRRRRRPAAWDSSQGIRVLDEANDERPYPVVNYVFRANGHYYLHLVMHCSRYPLTDGMRDALGMIVQALEALIGSTSPASGIFDEGLAKALSDAALGRRPLSLKKADRDLLERAGFAEGCHMRLAVCDLGYLEEDHQLPGFAAFRLSQQFPSAYVFVCGMKVAILAKEGDEGPTSLARDALSRQLAAAMDDQRIQCGLSDAFASLGDLRFAYLQADAACAMADDGAVATFHEAFARYAVGFARDEELLDWCVERSVPAALQQEAEADYELLRRFLECERRATAVAEEMHLHRTSLLYRVKSLEKRFGIDLDDGATRRRILLEYDMLENASRVS